MSFEKVITDEQLTSLLVKLNMNATGLRRLNEGVADRPLCTKTKTASPKKTSFFMFFGSKIFFLKKF